MQADPVDRGLWCGSSVRGQEDACLSQRFIEVRSDSEGLNAGVGILEAGGGVSDDSSLWAGFCSHIGLRWAAGGGGQAGPVGGP